MIKNIFFDFDGVLAESVNIKTEAFRKIYLPYGEETANKVVKHHLENGGMSRFEKFKIYQDWIGSDSSTSKIDALASLFSNMVMQGVIDSPEVKGTNAFLEEYFNQYRYWIISGTPTEEVKEIATRRKIKKYFTGIFGSPDKKNEITERILSLWNLLKSETVFVGDATTDYNAATVSGIKFILRETPENSSLFKNFKGQRIYNMTQLHDALSIL